MKNNILRKTLIELFLDLKYEKNRGITFIKGLDDEHFVAYSQLYDNAIATLEMLQDQGVRQSDELVIQIEDNEKLLTIFWACILGQIIPVPLSVGAKEIGLYKLIKVWANLNNPFLITDESHFQKVLAYTEGESFKEPIKFRFIDANQPIISNRTIVPECAKPDDLAFIQYSSGSTGTPKGVMLSHRNLVYNIHDCIVGAEITSASRGLCWIPLTHDLGMIAFHLSHVLAGANQYIFPTALFIRRPLLWLLKASEHRATILYSPNFGIKYYLDALPDNNGKNLNLHSVKTLINGAEPISTEICRCFVKRLSSFGLNPNCIQPSYGLAEASVGVSSRAVNAPLKEYFLKRENIQIGKPLVEVNTKDTKEAVSFVDLGKRFKHTEIRICDEQNLLLRANYIGHVQIKGPNVTRGYYNNSEASQKVFTADGWLKTGDVGFLTNDDSIVITGRYKNIIILNGQNYYAHDIERMLYGISDIDLGRIAVCGVPASGNTKEQLLIFIVNRKPLEQFVQLFPEINARLKACIGVSADHILPLKSLPKTTSGKVQYFQLLENFQKEVFKTHIETIQQLLSKEAEQKSLLNYSFEDLFDELQEAICFITKINPNEITKDTNLVDLAIDSLEFIRIVQWVQKKYGTKLEIEHLYTRLNTVEKVIAHLFKSTKSINDKLCTNTVLSINKNSLSANQQSLWYINKVNPGVENNIGLTFSIRGKLDLEKWQKHLLTIINRHDALRSVFKFQDGGLFRFVEESVSVLPLVSFSESNLDLALKRLKEDFNAPFDLTQAPLFRLILVQVVEDYTLVSFCLHHIIADGWSLKIIFDEFYALLQEQELPILEASFSDFICYENQLSHSDKFEEVLDFYKPLLDIDFKKARFLNEFKENTQKEKPGQTFEFHIEKSIVTQLSKENKTTPFLILLTVYHLVLAQYANTQSVLTVSPVSRREDWRWNNTVGYFSNLQYLRTNFRSEQSFVKHLQNLKDQYFATLAWQDIPYSQIVEKVFESDLDGKAGLLNQFLFSYHSLNNFNNLQKLFAAEKENKLETKGMTFEMLKISQQANAFPLSLEIFDIGDELFAFFKFQNEAARDILLSVATNFKYLLTLFAIKPDSPLNQLCLLDELQQKSVLQFGRSEEPFILRTYSTVIEAFEAKVEQTPNKVSYVFEGQSTTFEELNQCSNQLANYICKTYALKPEDNVGLKLPKGKWLIPALLAIHKSRATFVPIDPAYPLARQEFIEKNAQLKLLLDEEVLASFDKVKHQYATSNPEEKPSSDQVAYIMYTSGSTGQPKGVMIQHHALYNYTNTFIDYFGITDRDTIIQQSSISFDTFIEELFPSLLSGAKVLMLRHGGKDIDDIVHCIDSLGATVLSTTPLVINELNQVFKEIHQLRLIISGGDLLEAKHISRLVDTKVDLYNTYGPTETTVCATYSKIESGNLDKVSIIGHVIPSAEVYILNKNAQLSPIMVEGEIGIGGRGLAKGYFNLPEESKNKFVLNPIHKKQRIYTSGDLGRWLPDGQIEFLGRIDAQVKIRGYRIELMEIETILNQYENIESAVVIVRDLATSGKCLVGFYEENKSVDPTTLRQFLLDKLPIYMVPAHFVKVEKIPLNPNGKINRNAAIFQTRAIDVNPQEIFLPASTETELKLERIWSELLNIAKDKISVNDDFLQNGGNSLLLMKFKNRVELDLDISIEVERLLKGFTIKNISDYVESIKWIVMEEKLELQQNQEIFEL